MPHAAYIDFPLAAVPVNDTCGINMYRYAWVLPEATKDEVGKIGGKGGGGGGASYRFPIAALSRQEPVPPPPQYCQLIYLVGISR